MDDRRRKGDNCFEEGIKLSLEYYIKNIFGKLDEDHFKVLRAIEMNLQTREVVPVEIIGRITGFGWRVEKLLKKLHEYKLIWAPRGVTRGYALNYYGMDLLALKSLVDRNVIASFGKPLGVGKEADVYDALSPKGIRLAVKFFRIGRTSFRGYEKHRTALMTAHTYMLASIRAAAREYRALRILYPKGVAVPKPIARDRHVIVTEVFYGIEISSTSHIENPVEVLCEIIKNLKLAYDAGVVHSDLSVYNILITPEQKILIIDWPQWVDPKHPMAQRYMVRDMRNLLKFFRRKWNVLELPIECQRLIKDLCGETFNTLVGESRSKGMSG